MFSPASMVAGIRDSLILFPMRKRLSSGIDNLIFVDTSDSFQAICITRPLDARNGSREYGIDAWDGGSSCSYWRHPTQSRGVSVCAMMRNLAHLSLFKLYFIGDNMILEPVDYRQFAKLNHQEEDLGDIL